MAFFGPYRANVDGTITYVGNRIHGQINDIKALYWPDFSGRTKALRDDLKWHFLQKIDAAIFTATVDYFGRIDAKWTNLPLTTLMISSPGEVYAGQTLNYTTDALPMEFSKWFDHDRRVFLSESSQFYLELALSSHRSSPGQVFSIYNSFRKESGDPTHLSEFQHIEYEGHVTGDECIQIGINLLRNIITRVLEHEEEAVSYFLDETQIQQLEVAKSSKPLFLDFEDALAILSRETKQAKYDEFSMRYFGSWEEIKLTEVLGNSVVLRNFPLLQIPFYHAHASQSRQGVLVADNADLILSGYRETIGSGRRISGIEALSEKARIFNLPLSDYEPYFNIRRDPSYRPSAGFGLGWQRLVHWMLCLPHISEATLFPRGHTIPTP